MARLIFGPGQPAIAFLLLLAIADDAAGLVILAVAYPQAPVRPVWLLLAVAAVVVALLLRRLRLQSFWWYLLIPGTLSWFSFHFTGIHPALGLVPIIPCLPHAHSDLGIFAREELNRQDTLSDSEWPDFGGLLPKLVVDKKPPLTGSGECHILPPRQHDDVVAERKTRKTSLLRNLQFRCVLTASSHMDESALGNVSATFLRTAK